MTRLPTSFGPIIAEEPYDEMGAEFRRIFGTWLDETSPRKDAATPAHLQVLAFDLFQRRLALAQRFRTFFASQVVKAGRELWRERYAGLSDSHCYSFAIRGLPRTRRFFQGCEATPTPPNDHRTWDTAIKPYPSLPCGPHDFYPTMPVWSHRHQPEFRARRDGPLFVRRLQMNDGVYLIEHFDGRWVPNLRSEAAEHWTRANEPRGDFPARLRHLAAFEYLWFWTNPFGRAGALTGDALSLLTQKQLVMDGRPLHIRPGYYHQDCEAFLMGFEAYVEKRTRDMTQGFVPRYPMDLPAVAAAS